MNRFKYIAVLSLLFCFGNMVKATPDTLLFVYNVSTANLTIVGTYNINKIVPHVYYDSLNEMSKMIANENLIDSYRQLSPDSKEGTKLMFENATWFDTNLCQKLDIRAFVAQKDDPNNISKSQKFVIKYKIIEPELLKEEPQEPISEKTETQKELFLICAGITLVALLTIIIILGIVRRRKKKNKLAKIITEPKKTNENENPPEPQNMTTEVSENKPLAINHKRYVNGLNHVREQIHDYYMMDMQKNYQDTAVHQIFLHYKAVKKMYDFFKQSIEDDGITNETGCYFVGRWEYDDAGQSTYNITLEDIVEPGDDIEPSEFSFSFGLQIGVMLYSKNKQLSEQTGHEYVHTVWMHSHPGLGLFLSSHDIQVQRQIVNPDHPKRMAAFVIDTNTPEFNFAVFTSKTNGEMNNGDDITQIYALEELYEWSRKTHAGENININTKQAQNDQSGSELDLIVDEESFFTVITNSARKQKAWFSGRSINSIDDITYEHTGKHLVGGYLLGKTDTKGDLLVEDCKPIVNFDNIPNDAIGLLVIDNTANDDDIKTYVSQKDVSFVILYKGDDELFIIRRKVDKDEFEPIDISFKCSIREMKEWTRRRRIYK